MNCTQCASKMPDDSQFCPNCGHPTSLASPMGTPDATPHPPAPVEVMTDVQRERQLSQANVFRLKKEFEKAIDTCIQVLKSDPANATAHSLLGDIYREQGKIEDALRWYQMALELKPNPTDRKKLAELEKEFAFKSSSPTKVLRGAPAVPIHADGTIVAGTTRLVGGVSPQNWLRWVTGITIAFLGIVVIGLTAYRVGQRSSKPTPTQPLNAPSGFSSNSALPPAKPLYGAPPSPSTPAPSVPQGSEGGTGFPPDQPGAVSPSRPQTQQPNSTSGIAPPDANGGVSPAKVSSVAPAPNQPRLVKGEEEEAGGDKTSLPGSMWIAGISKGKTEQQAQVEIGTPFTSLSEMNADQRRQLLRNLFRAGKRVFTTFTALQEIDFYATNDSRTHPESRQTFLTARVERAKLEEVDIGNATEEQLTQALTQHQWADAKPNPTPDPTPAKPTTPAKPEPHIVIELNSPKKQ